MKECQTPELSIVVPVYKNKEALYELYKRLINVLKTLSIQYEIIFVDDACPHGSLSVLVELAVKDPNVSVLALQSNNGQHRAVLVGISFSRGKWVVVMDGDLQDPPEAIPELLYKIKEGAVDAIFAGRRGKYESASRLLTSRLFKSLLHIFSGVPVDAGLFVIMNRNIIERLMTFNNPNPFLVAMMGCTGLPLTSIPVMRNKRPAGSSSYSAWMRLKIGIRTILWLFSWKLGLCRFTTPYYSSEIPVKKYIGSRFPE